MSEHGVQWQCGATAHSEHSFPMGEAHLYLPDAPGQGHLKEPSIFSGIMLSWQPLNTHLPQGNPRVFWSFHNLSFWFAFLWHPSASPSHVFSSPGRPKSTEILWIPPTQTSLASCELVGRKEVLNRTWILSVCVSVSLCVRTLCAYVCVCVRVSRQDRSCYPCTLFPPVPIGENSLVPLPALIPRGHGVRSLIFYLFNYLFIHSFTLSLIGLVGV